MEIFSTGRHYMSHSDKKVDISSPYLPRNKPPWGRRGFKPRIRPPYPQRVVKGD